MVFPPTYKTFPTRQEAKDWAQQEEARRRRGAYFPEQSSRKHALEDLIVVVPKNWTGD